MLLKKEKDIKLIILSSEHIFFPNNIFICKNVRYLIIVLYIYLLNELILNKIGVNFLNHFTIFFNSELIYYLKANLS